ncbi:MAG: HD domain-containing phosphohydrolase [Vicinamibacterales bacterium]
MFEQEPDTAAPVGAVRALVVDDDRALRRTLCRAIAPLGISAIEASDGREALLAIEEFGEFPLVISDLRMPVMDGLALLREVLRRFPDTAVIMLTGVAEVGTAVEALQAGAVDYVSKPVVVGEFRARVAKALEKRRLVLENRYLQESYQGRLEAMVRELDHKNKEQFLGQIQMAVRMLEKKDYYTRGHSRRVSQYAVRMSVVLGFTGGALDQIRLGGELHDIGKIGTRDALLNKPGPLTTEEFEHVRQHVIEGEEMLEPLRRDWPVVLEIVRFHHERMDGLGFPDGLRGEAIPMPARIVCVADAFDAMTTTRAYGVRKHALLALEELKRHAGSQFDPNVVAAFEQAFPDVTRIPFLPQNADAGERGAVPAAS